MNTRQSSAGGAHPHTQGALALLLTMAAACIESPAGGAEPTHPFTNLRDSLPKFTRLGHAAAARSDPSAHDDDAKSKRRRRRRGSAASDASSTDASAHLPAPQAHRRFLPIPYAALLPPAAIPAPAPPHVRRFPQLFVGQLMKNAAAESLQAILALLAPHVVPVYIEPLYNRETGQGRGCAWLYLRDAEDASAILELHHRAFLDADATTGGVGLWVCDSRGEEELRAFADARVAGDYVLRKKKMLPRQPLVVEYAARALAPTARPVAAPGEPWALWPVESPAVPAAALLGDAQGPFPRSYPDEGVVLVAPKRYRHDPYLTATAAAAATPPTYREAVWAGPAPAACAS